MQKNRFMQTILTSAVVLFGTTTSAQQGPAANEPVTNPDAEIRPFHVHFSDGALADLRRRVLATNWPDRETVSDLSQGLNLETMKALAHYWTTEYDWREIEARLNGL